MNNDKYGPEIIKDLYEQMGPARKPFEVTGDNKGAAPEAAYYNNCHEFMEAAVEFSVNSKHEDVQEKFVASREKLRGSFRELIHQTLGSSELDLFSQRNIIGGAYKDKDEERVAFMKELFPEGMFTEIPMDRCRLIRRIGSMIAERSTSTSGKLGIVDELTEDFTRHLSKAVREAYAIELDEKEEHKEEFVDIDEPLEDITEFLMPEISLYNSGEWEA